MAIVDKLVINGVDVSYKKVLVNGKQIEHITINGETYDYPDYFLEFTSGKVTGIGDTVRKDIIIPSKIFQSSVVSDVTSIGEEAFYNCKSLTSIEIPDSVTWIGTRAFCLCKALTNITIPESVTGIGNTAFAYCDSLQFNEYGNAKYLGSKANDYFALIEAVSTDLSNYTIHNSTKIIAYSAFSGCSSLTSITIPDSVTSVGGGAFKGCSNLTSVTGPAFAVSYVPLSKLQKVVITSGDYINSFAFQNCTTLTSVTIPDSVTSIGSYAFNGCIGLTSINLGSGLTSIGNDAFSGCYYLTSITIPNGVTTIGNSAFDGCGSLTSVMIPDSVTSIGERVFAYCRNLTSITFNGTKAQWNAIEKGSRWKYDIPATKVVCSDGEEYL